ncbi:MAG: 2-isopropylmalate synthase, partial [Planctomycetota bacterium]|nr:2-isopropylmalate synthase [Planctomycetota bacterium]
MPREEKVPAQGQEGSNPKEERVVIFDTTLRDGEQSPGCSMNREEKLQVARALEQLRVDVIEAGFPVVSPDDFDAVKAVAETIEGTSVAALARSLEKDIKVAADALRNARRPRIHVFLATSAIHRQYKLKKAESEILRQAVEAVRYAKTFCGDVEFSPEDASRTEPEFLAQVVEAVIDAGATTVNIPDTVGYAMPHQFGATIAMLKSRVPNIGRAVISVHCHDDLGLAAANSLAAVLNGARQVECTINGLGERAGNCALEEIVMAIRTRTDVFRGFHTGVDTRRLYPTSRLVSKLTGMVVQRNKAIVGENAFAHEAGIHQDGILKERTTYEIMKPSDIGIPDGSRLVLGKHSGRHALKARLEYLGYSIGEKDLDAVFDRFKVLCDKKKRIYDADIEAILDDILGAAPEIYQLSMFQVSTGNKGVPTATVELRKGKDA